MPQFARTRDGPGLGHLHIFRGQKGPDLHDLPVLPVTQGQGITRDVLYTK